MTTVTFSIPEQYHSTCDVQQELAKWTQELAINIFFRRDEVKKKRRNSFTAAERAAVALLQDEEDDKGTTYMDDDVDLPNFIKEKNEWVAQQEKQFLESSQMVSNK